MGFQETLQERYKQVMAAKSVERSHLVDLARSNWLGRLVVFQNDVLRGMCPYLTVDENGWITGEVSEVTDRGRVKILYAVGENGKSLYCDIDVVFLGTSFFLAGV